MSGIIICIVLLSLITVVEIKGNIKHRKWESELVDLICEISNGLKLLYEKESPEPIHNIDYTAALEPELLHWENTVSDYRYTKEQMHDLATRLNAAITRHFA